MACNLERLRRFITEATRIADQYGSAGMAGAPLQAALAELVSQDDWLPESCAQSHPAHYQQHLLHCDPLERFSLVSFVWGPGQATPIHDHTVWGYVAMLRGSEVSQRYRNTASQCVPDGLPSVLQPGQIEVLSPADGDIHRVWNAHEDTVSISVHLYGGNIGAIARHVFNTETGESKPFVSGYSNTSLPNLWDRSEAVRRTLLSSN